MVELNIDLFLSAPYLDEAMRCGSLWLLVEKQSVIFDIFRVQKMKGYGAPYRLISVIFRMEQWNDVWTNRNQDLTSETEVHVLSLTCCMATKHFGEIFFPEP